MKEQNTNWPVAFKPVFKKYEGIHHPLKYQSHYQLIVMVVFSARATDAGVNKMAPALFKAFPNFDKLSKAKLEDVLPFVTTIPGYIKKTGYVLGIANVIKSDKNIKQAFEDHLKLPGIGRKSMNVIRYEMGMEAEGVIVDLHTLRVAPRLGIAVGTNPEKIEKALMEIFPQKDWGVLGMSLTYIGRELCRPTDPKCSACKLNKVCEFYNNQS